MIVRLSLYNTYAILTNKLFRLNLAKKKDLSLSKETKRRTINYKLVKLGDHPLTLQEMLESTLLDKRSQYHLATNRRESLTEDEKSFRFINRFANYMPAMLLCQIVQFEQGRSQMTITIDDNAEMFEVTPISAHDLNGHANAADTTEFLESLAYFGVMGNHMVVMGSQSLKSKELERHLNWYLNTLTQQGINSAVMLSDKPTLKAMKQLRSAPAKSVSIGSDILYEDSSSPMTDAPQTETYEKDVIEAKSVRWTPVGLGAKILECLKENGYVGDFNFEDTLDNANLQVSIEFKYNRKTTTSGQRVIDTLSTSLRHIDKDDVKINLKGGGEIKGDDLKLSRSISVVFMDGKVDESDLYFKMKQWLDEKINTGEVTPDLQDVIEE